MSAQPEPKVARRVITDVDADGRSVIVSDATTPTWVRRPTGTIVMDLWRVDALGTGGHRHDAGRRGGGGASRGGCLRPPGRVPPDKDVDAESAAAFADAIHDIYGQQGATTAGPPVPGMHRTDTVDVVTVVDGEIWVVLDDGETLLKAGDCLIQRGTRHAWQNRSDRPCTLATTMLAAVR